MNRVNLNGANFAGDRKFVWLASYPKSGNTWLRSLLSAYLLDEEDFNLNALLGDQDPFDRQTLDDHAGISSADFLREELLPYQAQLHCDLARASKDWRLFKTHSTFARTGDGALLFPSDASAGAIVIVRNPIDIVPSYAHHEGKDCDWVIKHMRDEAAGTDSWTNRSTAMVPQLLSSWSNNVRSWLQQDAVPVLLIRYEDMHSQPDAELIRALRFCAIDVDDRLVSKAIARCNFDRLSTDEKVSGFSERPSSQRAFFRSGKVGDGTTALTRQQIGEILRDHSAVMELAGYPADPNNYMTN